MTKMGKLFLDPTTKYNYYLDCLNLNIYEAQQKESGLVNILSKIESNIDANLVSEEDLKNLEIQVTDAALKLNGINTLKELILLEENTLIKKGVNSMILDSIRTRREPAFKQYDTYFENVASYDARIETISQKLSVDFTLIQELFLDFKSRQVKLYEEAAKTYEKVKSQISQQK